MNRTIPIVAATLLAVAGASAQGTQRTATAGETVFVSSREAVLRQTSSPSSPVVATLGQGAALTVREVQGLRYLVETGTGQRGYIVRLNTSATRPRTTTDGMGGLLRDDRGAAEQRTSGSIRGLRPEAIKMREDGEVGSATVDDVTAMQDLAASITDAEIDAFNAEGGVVAP
ncbi:MAG: SH3 domain-containing protein [Candidatus Sumerlaeia bacterium]|nr:SH3 domain-containing protein [Candidatus Sumerlaeia bacterium]